MPEKDTIVLYWERETVVPQHPNNIRFQLEEALFPWAEGWLANFSKGTQLCFDLRTMDNIPVTGLLTVNVALSYSGPKTFTMLPDGHLLQLGSPAGLGPEYCWVSEDGMLKIEPVIVNEQMVVQLMLIHEEGEGRDRIVSFGTGRFLIKCLSLN